MLIKAADSVLPGVRKALASRNPEVRARAIRVLAWKGDIEALPTLKGMSQTDPADADLLAWAITKIQMLHSAP
jgi:glycerophosphoryl diester phosphodiesterase